MKRFTTKTQIKILTAEDAEGAEGAEKYNNKIIIDIDYLFCFFLCELFNPRSPAPAGERKSSTLCVVPAHISRCSN
jgi:hypothetical protein